MSTAPSFPRGASVLARAPSVDPVTHQRETEESGGAPEQLGFSPLRKLHAKTSKPQELSGVNMLNFITMVKNCAKPCYGTGRLWSRSLPRPPLVVAPGWQRMSSGQMTSAALGRGCVQDQIGDLILHQKPSLLPLRRVFRRCKAISSSAAGCPAEPIK